MSLPIHSSSNQTSGPACVLAVAAGKGGVGKSTVTVNLARALHAKGRKVGILDADLYGPSLRRMLPEERLPSQVGPSIIPALCQGIKVISMAYFRQDNISTSVRAPIANSLIAQFCDQVEWGPLDYLLIDFPPGTGDIQLTLSQKAKLDGAIMVTTPQQVAVMDVRKAMHLFHQVHVPILGIVENMSYYMHAKSGETVHLFGEGGGRMLAEETGIPLLEQVPIDPALSLSGDQGYSPFSDDVPLTSGARAFHFLALKVEERVACLHSEGPIKRLTRDGDTHIRIEWSDGQTNRYRLSELQRNCPCAGCADQQKASEVAADVQCLQVSSVGHYALKIQFASGCSNGIYTYDMLRQLTPKKPS